MENGAIHDSRITASSSLDNKHTALQARLHLTADSRTGGGWSALKDDFYQWLQIELGGYTTVTRVATQGGNGRNEWVTQYRLLYSSTGNIFMYYKLRENSSAMVSTKSSVVFVRFVAICGFCCELLIAILDKTTEKTLHSPQEYVNLKRETTLTPEEGV